MVEQAQEEVVTTEEKAEDVAGQGELSPTIAFGDVPMFQGVVCETHVVASNPVAESLSSAKSRAYSEEDDVEKMADDAVDHPSFRDVQDASGEVSVTEPIAVPAVLDVTKQQTSDAPSAAAHVDDHHTESVIPLEAATTESSAPQEEDNAVDSADDFVLIQKSDVAESEPVEPVSQPSSTEGTHGDLLAEGAAVAAAGSLLVAAAVAEAPEESSEEIPHGDVSRDISQGIPNEPSAHDLPPYSPSPDAAKTVEPAKKLQSAGSQYGTFQTDQQAAQQASRSVDERERTESSASPSIKGVVVKDAGVASKPNPLSTTSGKLTILASVALGVYAVFKLANGGTRYP